MQDEITKHTRKIYHTIKKPGHSTVEKIKEVAVEICIIVFAVTLSIWLHSWSEHRHEQQETREFLRGLKSDLAADISLFQANRITADQVDSNFVYIRRLYDSHQIDTASESTIAHHLLYELSVTHANVGRYDGFKASGKLGTIENDSLRQHILVYYQQTIAGLADIEEVVNNFQLRILDIQLEKNDHLTFRDLAKTFKMQALLSFGVSNLSANNKYYKDAICQAQKIIADIDADLKGE